MGVLFRSRRNRGKRRNIIPKLLYSLDKKRKAMKKNFWEVVIRIAIAALTAALTALGTTSCMGYGPF